MWLSGSSYRKSFIFEMTADQSRKNSIEPHDLLHGLSRTQIFNKIQNSGVNKEFLLHDQSLKCQAI